MDTLRTGVMVGLLAPASCQGLVFTEPLTCYVLDGFLMAYCIIATMLYFRLKFFPAGCVAAEEPDPQGPPTPDPYQDLEPVRRKKKDVRRKKPRKSPEKKSRPALPSSSTNAPPSP